MKNTVQKVIQANSPTEIKANKLANKANKSLKEKEVWQIQALVLNLDKIFISVVHYRLRRF